MELLGELVRIGGLAFALACVALLAILRGDVIVKKSYEEMVREKDAQIRREQDRSADLWGLLRPSLGVAKVAVDKLRDANPAEPGS